ncbi:MAG: polysaccharide biosynthesis C-terminal domain-containing protein [Planctomycetaceae bacterium]|nr:polysaccharide biosynthesis C-terminal domain-containing protein [Planctomycetaceae bacterium]
MTQRATSLSAMLVALAMLLGRMTGLLRILGLATVLGVTHANDLAILVISVPDILNAMLVGGALGVVLIPEMHRCSEEVSEQSASQLIVQSFFVVAILASALTFLLIMGGTWFTSLLASGFTTAQINEASKLISIVLLAFPVSAVTAVTSAVLQGHHKPVIPAYGNLFFNLVLILVIFLWVTPGQIEILAWAVVAASAFRLLTQLFCCYFVTDLKGAFHSFFRLSFLNRKLMVNYFQALAAIGLVVAFPVVSRSFASMYEGGISLFEYSQKLVELPRGLIGAVISMVIFPRLSRVFAAGDLDTGARIVSQTAGLILLISIPAGIAVYVSAEPVVSLLFQRGQFSDSDVAATAKLLQIAVLSMPALFLSILTMNVFYARHETITPFKISCVSLVCLILLSLGLRELWGMSGVMLAFVLTSWLHFLGLTISLYIKFEVSVIQGIDLKHYSALVFLTFSGISISTMIVNLVSDHVQLFICSAGLGGLCFGAVLLILKNHLPSLNGKLSL